MQPTVMLPLNQDAAEKCGYGFTYTDEQTKEYLLTINITAEVVK
jgi:hypothetical protein